MTAGWRRANFLWGSVSVSPFCKLCPSSSEAVARSGPLFVSTFLEISGWHCTVSPSLPEICRFFFPRPLPLPRPLALLAVLTFTFLEPLLSLSLLEIFPVFGLLEESVDKELELELDRFLVEEFEELEDPDEQTKTCDLDLKSHQQ